MLIQALKEGSGVLSAGHLESFFMVDGVAISPLMVDMTGDDVRGLSSPSPSYQPFSQILNIGWKEIRPYHTNTHFKEKIQNKN